MSKSRPATATKLDDRTCPTQEKATPLPASICVANTGLVKGAGEAGPPAAERGEGEGRQEGGGQGGDGPVRDGRDGETGDVTAGRRAHAGKGESRPSPVGTAALGRWARHLRKVERSQRPPPLSLHRWTIVHLLGPSARMAVPLLPAVIAAGEGASSIECFFLGSVRPPEIHPFRD